MEEYLVQCWNCALEFDALAAQWCGCSAISPTKICPYCYSCMCKAPDSYRLKFWKEAPQQLQDETSTLSQPRDKLGDLLVKQNLITTDQLLRALQIQKQRGEKLGTVLVKLGYVTEEDVRGALSQQFGMTAVNLERVEIHQDLIDEIGIDLIKKYCFVPVEKQELPTKVMVTIALSAPLSPTDLEALQQSIGYTIYPVLAQDKIFQKLFEQIVNRESEVAKQSRFIQQAKVLVNDLLTEALKRRASEILIEPEDNELAIFFRIGGRLFKTASPSAAICPFVEKRLKVLGKIDASASESTGTAEGSFIVKTKNKSFNFLMKISPIPSGERITILIIDESIFTQKLGKVFLDPGTLSLLHSLLKLKAGIVVIMGPVGSGKNITQYAIMNALDEPGRKIVSVEDPIIMYLPHVTQLDLSVGKRISYADQVGAALQESPDVLVLSQINDRRTAELVFQHSQDMLIIMVLDFVLPSELMLYLSGIGISRQDLSQIIAIINQRILPSLCMKCRVEMPLDDDDARYFQFDSTIGARAYRGIGCDACSETGYAGFLPLNEIVVFDVATRKSLKEKTDLEWLNTLSPPQQTRGLRKLAADLLSKGWINIEDARSIDLMTDIPAKELKSLNENDRDVEDTDKNSLMKQK